MNSRYLTLIREKLDCNVSGFLDLEGTFQLSASQNNTETSILQLKARIKDKVKEKGNTRTTIHAKEEGIYLFPMNHSAWMFLQCQHDLDDTTCTKISKFIVHLARLLGYASEEHQLKLFYQMFDHASDAIQVSDESGRLVFINKSSAGRLGIDQNNVHQYFVKDFEKIFEAPNSWENHVEEVKKLGELVLEGKNVHQITGQMFPVEVTVKYVSIDNKGYMIASSRDISERVKNQEIIQRQISLQDILIRMAGTYINIPPEQVNKAIEDALHEMAIFVGADRSYVFTYDFKKRITTNTHEWCAEGIEPQIEYLGETPMDLFPQWLEKHQKGEAFLIEDLSLLDPESDKGLIEILSPQDIKSLISIPMIDRGILLGFVGFDSVRNIHYYSEQERKLLFVFAQLLVNIRRKENLKKQIGHQEERFKNLIDNMDLGLVEYDHDHRVIFANQKFCKLAGYNPLKIIGKKVTERFLGEDYDEYLKLIDSTPENSSLVREIFIKTRYADRWWFVSSNPQYNNDGDRMGTIVVHLDIHEQKTMQDALLEAQKTAEQAIKAKEIFLSNMSHEIRTPLTTIIGMIRLLHKEQLNKNQKIYVQKTISTAEHLLAVLNNTIDINKIGEGALTLICEPFQLETLCRNIFDLFSIHAEEKHILMKLSLDAQIAKTLVGDETRIRQILFNLVSNAIKFTEKGYVKLSADVLEHTKEYQRIQVEVTDTGIGMSESFVSKIFDKYAQDARTKRLQTSGSGLGMFIARDLATLMESEIIIKSKPGHGTTVSFQLKLPISDKEVPAKLSQSPVILKNIKALLVEDDETNRFIVAHTLVNAGCSVMEAENGQVAVDLLINENFDIILMDIQMPVMDGLEASKYIRNNLRLMTPIIAFTANAFKQDIEQYMKAGMNDFIKKPYDENQLIQKIQALAPAYNQEESEEKVNNIQSNQSEKLYELNKLWEIGGDDKEFLQRILISLADQFSESIDVFKSAAKENDTEVIRKTAHKIKPNVELIQAWSLLDSIKILESLKPDDTDKFLHNYHFEYVCKQLALLVSALRRDSTFQ